ncbi:MAG TPA: carbohydrate ABC transporter permease [Clostridiaceae bacterium]|nr:carbohydrate ABC transporter permease [Clostridiaceae bacterium]
MEQEERIGMQLVDRILNQKEKKEKELKKIKKYEAFDIIIIIMIGIFAFLVFYPFYNTFVVSIATEFEYYRTPLMLFPKKPDFLAYELLFTSTHLWRGFLVTIFVVVVGVAYQLFLTTTLAYCLSKQYPGTKLVSFGIMVTMYFGGGLIPFYLLMVNLKLVNSIFSMIWPTGIGIGYMVIMRDYFSNLPKELEESALIEGASEMTVFAKIYLPLSIPLLVTIGLYYGVDRWNEYYLGMLFIQDAWKRPLQLILMDVITEYMKANPNVPATIAKRVYSEGMKMATIMVTTIPIMAVYPFLQKYFVKGLTTGAVKS